MLSTFNLLKTIQGLSCSEMTFKYKAKICKHYSVQAKKLFNTITSATQPQVLEQEPVCLLHSFTGFGVNGCHDDRVILCHGNRGRIWIPMCLAGKAFPNLGPLSCCPTKRVHIDTKVAYTSIGSVAPHGRRNACPVVAQAHRVGGPAAIMGTRN